MSHKARSRKQPQEQPKPKSGLNVSPCPLPPRQSGADGERQVESLLDSTENISLSNAVPQFKQRVEKLTEKEEFGELAGQMFRLVAELVRTSVDADADANNCSRACEMLRVVRDESRELEWPETYNELLRQFKDGLVAADSPAGRRSSSSDMWATVRKFNLGLLTKDEAGQHTAAVDDAEARAVRCLPFTLSSPLLYSSLFLTRSLAHFPTPSLSPSSHPPRLSLPFLFRSSPSLSLSYLLLLFPPLTHAALVLEIELMCSKGRHNGWVGTILEITKRPLAA